MRNRTIALAIITMLAILTSVNAQSKTSKSAIGNRQTKETGKWTVVRSKDEMTDNESVRVRLLSDDGKYLLWVVVDNELWTHFGLSNGVIADGSKALIRFDEKPAFDDNWALRMNGKVAIFSRIVTLKMSDQHIMRVRFEEKYSGLTTTVKFDVRGLFPALKSAGFGRAIGIEPMDKGFADRSRVFAPVRM
jgi:hypothetical protein